MSDKALMNRSTLELTQKIQMHFPLEIKPEVLKFWNGCTKEFLQEYLSEVFSKIPKEMLLLQFICTTEIPAIAEKFITRDHFIVDKSEKAKVKISYLGENFQKEFLDKIEEPFSGSTLQYRKLRKTSADEPIITELGGEEKAETTLTEMFFLMEKQRNGEAGALLNNGYANIFYIKNSAGVLRAVLVNWGGGGWFVRAGSVADARGWLVGDRVFSRKPLNPQN